MTKTETPWALAPAGFFCGNSSGHTGRFPCIVQIRFVDRMIQCHSPRFHAGGVVFSEAILRPVQIDGATVSRASLHNLSFIEALELMPGNRVLVSKRNMIISHIEENLDRGGFDMGRVTLSYCPCCHRPTRIQEENGVKRLFCDNPDCATRRLRQFVYFVGKSSHYWYPLLRCHRLSIHSL